MSDLSKEIGGRAAAAITLINGIERLMAAMAIFGIVMLAGAIALVVVDIVRRRLLGGSVIGVIDITQLCVMAAAFWSIPYAFSKKSHVAVDFLAMDNAPRLRMFLAIVSALLSLGLLGLILWLAWARAMDTWSSGDISQDLGIPMIWYWGFLLSGLAAALVAVAAAFLREMIEANASKGSE
ncbi:TRAP transporter small permease subunit [Mesorhizobium sp. 1M-11]|uniref:TRAP transporter small permease n=1 Tax=Mesorhizobium sp. 1M-11 TaxID=1529006 RepID=UPI0006C74881|nr:TRAP transporter small permease subunit [Mesorhizobium sp. 1M-11]